jgi:hypothetical protein
MQRTFKIWCPVCNEWMVDLRHNCEHKSNGIEITEIEGKCLCGKPEAVEVSNI